MAKGKYTSISALVARRHLVERDTKGTYTTAVAREQAQRWQDTAKSAAVNDADSDFLQAMGEVKGWNTEVGKAGSKLSFGARSLGGVGSYILRCGAGLDELEKFFTRAIEDARVNSTFGKAAEMDALALEVLDSAQGIEFSTLREEGRAKAKARNAK